MLQCAVLGGLILSISGSPQSTQQLPSDAHREAYLDKMLSPYHQSPMLPNHKCEWTVYYDMWQPSFDKGQYEGPGGEGGAHCLEVCCNDPSCQGLQLESVEKYQCYKYSSAIVGLDKSKGRRLADGKWLTSQRAAWSVFIKTTPASSMERALSAQVELHPALTNNNCPWMVYYDVWIPSFDQGEYQGPGREGGAHCFETCCRDPTCQGLALESTEKYQCYKYSTIPTNLDSVRKGQPLEDGHWLVTRKQAWSIFVRVPVSLENEATSPLFLGSAVASNRSTKAAYDGTPGQNASMSQRATPTKIQTPNSTVSNVGSSRRATRSTQMWVLQYALAVMGAYLLYCYASAWKQSACDAWYMAKKLGPLQTYSHGEASHLLMDAQEMVTR